MLYLCNDYHISIIFIMVSLVFFWNVTTLILLYHSQYTVTLSHGTNTQYCYYFHGILCSRATEMLNMLPQLQILLSKDWRYAFNKVSKPNLRSCHHNTLSLLCKLPIRKNSSADVFKLKQVQNVNVELHRNKPRKNRSIWFTGRGCLSWKRRSTP